MSERVHHPLFARLYTRMARAAPEEQLRYRRELVAGLSGRVLELGAGTGIAFQFYPPGVTAVVAVEPEAYLRAQAEEAAALAPVPVEVLDTTAEHLPAEDDSFDAAVVSLVLCSVRDQARALAELRRVLRPGGELRYFEHVLSSEAAIATTQRWVDRLGWPQLFGGCHTARDTPAAVVSAGFEVQEERRLWVGPRCVVPVGTHVLGVARAR